MAAGDIDVIQRAEKLQARMALWPIVSQTSIANEFLIDIIKESLPEDAKRYELILRQQQQDAKNTEIQNLMKVLTEMCLDDTGQLKPEFQQYAPMLAQLKAQAENTLRNSPIQMQPQQQGK